VRLLVERIVVHTEVLVDSKKRVHAEVHYRIPGVVPTRTGTGAGQNYTLVRRIIELPVGRRSRAA
jgi:hypothetical protein